MDLFRAENIHAGYGSGNKVLHGIDISLAPASITALSGVNGAGKSTLAAALAGRIGVTSGNIYLDGNKITLDSPQMRVSLGVVLCPQGREIFPYLTVAENLRIGAISLPKTKRQRAIEKVLTALPTLQNMTNAMAGSLSGGQQQVLALGRAAAAEPRVLIVDEPSMGLAPSVVDTVYEYLKKLNDEGTALLIIEESPLRLSDIADRVLIMRRGEIIREGGAELLADDSVLTSALLGGE